MPLYAVYALLMIDSGLSAGQFSSLLLLWSITAFCLEVPSGALADRISRRRLLATAGLLRAGGYGLWIIAPSYPAFAVGFMLWGVSGALTSGTWEALVYDELAAAGAADRYTRVVGRAQTLRMVATLVGTGLGAPLVALGGYPAAGWVSVAVCVATAVVAMRFPEQPRVAAADEATGFGGYLGTLRAGLAEARRTPVVRRVLLTAAALSGISAVDEYLPLLGRDTGVPLVLIPVLLLSPYLGLAIGAELAGRMPAARPRSVAVAVAVGAGLFVLGAASGRPAGFLGIGVGFGTVWFATVLAEARLQQSMTGVARATVTSVAGAGAEAVGLITLAGYGLGSAVLRPTVLLAVLFLPALPLAAVLPRWLPPARQSDDDSRATAHTVVP
jgi:MFS family permease